MTNLLVKQSIREEYCEVKKSIRGIKKLNSLYGIKK